MEEIYRLLDDKITASWFLGYVSGEEIYDEICEKMEVIYLCLKRKMTYFLNLR